MGEVIVRKARVKDLDLLSSMALDILKYHASFDDYYTPTKDARKSQYVYLKSCIYSRRYLLLVIEKDNKILGYLNAWIKKLPPSFLTKQIGYINDAYVKPTCRRKGLIEQALEESYKWFKLKKIKRVELSVHLSNNIGLKAWIKYGFKPVRQSMKKFI